MIGILDYGFGNLRSVWNALDSLGEDPVLVKDSAELDGGLTHLIIPGVGAFDAAMSALEERSLVGPVREFASSGRPLLGICLGMQLLGSCGYEGQRCEGLGLVAGEVLPLSTDTGLTLPHAGWNTVIFQARHPVLEGLPERSDFYFVHSYHFHCAESGNVLGLCDYGQDFCAVVGQKNMLGVQFHPEKSQRKGLRLLENFCSWDGLC